MDDGWTVNTDETAQLDAEADRSKLFEIFSMKLGRVMFGWMIDAHSPAEGSWFFHVAGTRIRLYGTM